jgi:sugar phosphate permease
MRTFRTSGFVLGVLSSLYFYIYALMQIPSGILSDTWGPRKTVTLGALVMGVGSVLFGLSPNLGACYAGRFLIGLGVSVMMVNIMRICVEWYRADEMAMMNGLTTALGALGGLLATSPLAALSATLGWRLSFVMVGIFSVLLAWNCWRVVRDRPADCGLPPVHEHEASQGLAERRESPGIMKDVMAVFRNSDTWPPFFGFMAFYSSLMAFTGLWGIPYLTQVYDMSGQQAAHYMMVVSLGLVGGCPVVGWFSDRVLCRRKTPYAVCAFFYAVIWGIICFAGSGRPPLEYMYVLCFALGFFSAGFILSIVATKELNPLYLSGIAMGTCNTSGFLASALLQVILGKILDLNWDGTLSEGVRIYPLHAYRTAFFICFGVTIIGLIASLALKETRCRNWRPNLKG